MIRLVNFIILGGAIFRKLSLSPSHKKEKAPPHYIITLVYGSEFAPGLPQATSLGQ